MTTADGPEQPGQTIQIEVDWSDEPPTVYANGAQLTHTQTEFAVVFTEFAGFGGRRAREPGGPPRARVVSSVRLHPDTYFQFVTACASNWNKFVNAVSPPGSTPPKFKLVGIEGVQLEGLEPPGQAGAAPGAPQPNAAGLGGTPATSPQPSAAPDEGGPKPGGEEG